MKRKTFNTILFVLAICASLFGQGVGGKIGGGAPAGSFNVLPSVVSFNGPTGTCGGSCTAGAGTTMTITAPATITNGNALVIFMAVGQGNSQTFTPPAGFLQLGSTLSSVGSAKLQIAAFCKIASSESGNYTITWTSGTNIAVGWILNISGTSCTNDGIGTAVGNTSTLTASTFTPAKVQDLLVVFAAQPANNALAFLAVPAHGNTTGTNNGTVIGNIPWGTGLSPAGVVNWTLSGSANTNDSAVMIIAFPSTVTNSSQAFMPNSLTAAGALNSLNVSGGIETNGNTQSTSFTMANGGGCSPVGNAIVSGINAPNGNGANEGLMCLSSANNLILDTGGNLTFISTWGGNTGGPSILNGGGIYYFISRDLSAGSQDLRAISLSLAVAGDSINASSNNVIVGCVIEPCTGGTIEGDVIINAQSAGSRSVRIENGVQDEFWINGSGFVGAVPIVATGTPAAPTVTPTCPNGTCASTWAYKIIATDSNGGTSVASSAGSTAVNAATLDGTHFNTITWSKVIGAKTYSVFRSTVATSPATTGIIGTVNSGLALSFVDNNIAGDSSTAPAINTTGTFKPVGIVGPVSEPGAIHQTAQTAAITTATLCAASAPLCNTAGTYTVEWAFWEEGTACGTPGTGGVTLSLTWTDSNGTAHSAIIVPMDDASSLTAISNTFHFQTSNAVAWGSGNFNISSNGSIIQYATGYTACGVGTGTYGLDIAVTRKR